MAVALFTMVYVFVMNEANESPNSPPSVSLVGTTEGNNKIVLENRGGEDLSGDTTIIIFNVAGNAINLTVNDFVGWDTNGDGLWNVGEKLVYDQINIVGLQVEALVIDPVSDTIIMRGILQEGGVMEYPYVVTLHASTIESDTAYLWLEYNFRTNWTGNVRFTYKPEGGSWVNTSWSPLSNDEGNYNFKITGLIPETTYYYRAQLIYNTKIIQGNARTFETLGVVIGWWRMDSGVGTVAFDYSGRNNDGILYYGPVWTASVNNTGLVFDGIDDYVQVNDHSSLDVTDGVSIEAWVNTLNFSEGKYADIKNVIDTSEFGLFSVYEPNLIHISGDVFAVVCRGNSNYGYINTIRISGTGEIDPTVIDSYRFYGAACYFPNITQINGDIYAIAFQGPGDDGYIRTVQIANDGIINPLIIDTLEFDTAQGIEPYITHVANDIYAIAYTGDKNDGYLATVTIHSDGTIDNTVIDKKAFDAITEVNAMGQSREFDIIHINGDKYGIVYKNRDSDGEIRTITITGAGMITSPNRMDGYYEDKNTFDVFDGWRPDIIHIAGEYYGIVYKGFENSGTVRTIKLKNDGQIEVTFNRFKFDLTYGYDGKIIHIANNWYAVAYTRFVGGSTYYGYLRTFQLMNDGTVNEAGNDTYKFESYQCFEPNILHVNGDVYAISYRGSNGDGIIKTVQILVNGSIIKSIVDAGEIGIFDCEQPMIINVTNDIYAMIYQGLDDDGYIRTFNIYPTGIINDTIIDSWEYDPYYTHEPQIIHIDNDVYAIISPSTDWHGYVRTLRINETGIIFPIDEYEFEPVRCIRPSVVHVANDIYAVAYRGSGEDGYVSTLEIATDGTITPAIISMYEFYDGNIYFPEITSITNDVYAISYTLTSTYDGYIRTLRIQSDGTIIPAIIATSLYDNARGYRARMMHVNDTYYAMFYETWDHDGCIRTVQIQDDGQITSDWHADGSYYIDTITYDTSKGYYAHPVHIQERCYAFIYMDQWYNGWLKSVRIGENGAITNSYDDSVKYINSHGCEPYMLHLGSNLYAFAYRSQYYDGYVTTITIDVTPKTNRVVAKSGAYQLYADDDTIYGYINNQVLSAPLKNGFNYVVLTYDKTLASDQMRLYVNTTLKAKKTYATSISTNNNHIYFGGMHQQLDEIKLWRTALSQAEINQNYAAYASGLIVAIASPMIN